MNFFMSNVWDAVQNSVVDICEELDSRINISEASQVLQSSVSNTLNKIETELDKQETLDNIQEALSNTWEAVDSALHIEETFDKVKSYHRAVGNSVVDTWETVNLAVQDLKKSDLLQSSVSNTLKKIDTELEKEETIDNIEEALTNTWQAIDSALDIEETLDTVKTTLLKQRETAPAPTPVQQTRVIVYNFPEPPGLPDVWPPPNIASVEMKLCDINDPKTQSDIKQIGEMVYGLPRGVALIVNNRDFNGARDMYGNVLDDRHGTDLDATNLYKTFQELGLKVRETLNCTGKVILDEVEGAAENELSKSCFICVVLSHGANGIVYGVDGQPVHLADITNIAETALPYGPKIFIIQACQGSQRSRAVIKERNNPKTTNISPEPTTNPPPYEGVSLRIVQKTEDEYLMSLRMMENELATLDTSDSTASTRGIAKSAIHADIFIAMATVEGYVSWRNQAGSWFIQALVYALRKWAHCDDIDGIFTRVTNLVLRQEHRLFGYKQVAKKRSTLTKKFYFFPGITEEDVRRLQG